MSTQREHADDRHSVSGHPGWCSPAHCYRTEEGVRVHLQAPTCWEDDVGETRFETGLVGTEDEPAGTTYLELTLHSVPLVRGFVHAILPLGDARRLRDQLSAHLDAAQAARREADGAGALR